MTDLPKYGLIVVSAPSGAGKSTLCSRLLQELRSEVALSISTTSRPPRGAEQHGREYFFVSESDFQKQIGEDAFAEWAQVHGNYYGTSRKTLESFWSQGRHVLLDIDVQGAATLRKQYASRMISVFIAPPSFEVLEGRLRGRGTDSEATIQKRMKNAVEEMARKDEFDRVIVNDQFGDAYQQLKDVVKDFSSRMREGSWPEAR